VWRTIIYDLFGAINGKLSEAQSDNLNSTLL